MRHEVKSCVCEGQDNNLFSQKRTIKTLFRPPFPFSFPFREEKRLLVFFLREGILWSLYVFNCFKRQIGQTVTDQQGSCQAQILAIVCSASEHMAKPNSPFRLTPLRVYLMSGAFSRQIRGDHHCQCCLLKESACLLHLIGDKAQPTTRLLDRRCYPHTETVGSVGVWAVTNSVRQDCSSSTKPLGAHCHADAIYLFP